VCTYPGQTSIAPTPVAANSILSPRVKASKAAFDAEYKVNHGSGTLLAIDATFTTNPLPRSTMEGVSRCVKSTAANRFTSNIRRISSIGVRQDGAYTPTPALFINISIRPNAASASSAARSRSMGTARSAVIDTATPADFRRETPATRAPRRLNSTANDAPIPLEAPVRNMLLPSMRKRRDNSSMPDALLPLFPLGLVLFPRTSLPLHIFEERYKLMMNELLEDSREFGVVLTLEQGIASVGCTARIDRVTKSYDDGRMDLETTGYRRFEIAELNEERPFLSGEVTFFDDDLDPTPAPDTVVLKAIAGYYAMRALKSGESLPEPRLNDNQLSFQLAQAVMDVHVRQTILMSRSEAERIKRLAEHFPLIAARERRKEHFRTLVPRNGHARLLPSS
jgi:ATP-dependent Lon protease